MTITIRHVDNGGRDIVSIVPVKYGVAICPICHEKVMVSQ
jgi:hypothetical protein